MRKENRNRLLRYISLPFLYHRRWKFFQHRTAFNSHLSRYINLETVHRGKKNTRMNENTATKATRARWKATFYDYGAKIYGALISWRGEREGHEKSKILLQGSTFRSRESWGQKTALRAFNLSCHFEELFGREFFNQLPVREIRGPGTLVKYSDTC